MSQKLPNYLRTYRMRAGLSQDEVAFLLGYRTGAHVSRYERFGRLPNLRNAFAYQVVFRAPAPSLFGGSFDQVERATVQRARLLLRRLSRAKPEPITQKKLQALRAMTSGAATGFAKQP